MWYYIKIKEKRNIVSDKFLASLVPLCKKQKKNCMWKLRINAVKKFIVNLCLLESFLYVFLLRLEFFLLFLFALLFYLIIIHYISYFSFSQRKHLHQLLSTRIGIKKYKFCVWKMFGDFVVLVVVFAILLHCVSSTAWTITRKMYYFWQIVNCILRTLTNVNENFFCIYFSLFIVIFSNNSDIRMYNIIIIYFPFL